MHGFQTGIAWRELPEQYVPWQTAWKRHRRFTGNGSWDRIRAALLTKADAAREIDWSASVGSTINRAHQHGTNLTRVTGQPNHKNERIEPADYAIGRSCGGPGTKIHPVCDGRGRPVVLLIGPGQGAEPPMFLHLLGAIHVFGVGPGPAHARPERVHADKA